MAARKTPVADRALPTEAAWPDMTVAWFERLKANPGVKKWTDDDWDYAIETATVHAEVWSGDTTKTTDLRKRLDRIKGMVPRDPSRPWTSRDARELLELHRMGRSLSQIATLMDRGKAHISREAAALDITFDRVATKQATLAHIEDARAAKVEIERAEIEILQTTQQRHLRVLRGEEKWKTIVRGPEGDTVQEYDFVPPRDEREMSQARASMAGTIKTMADATSGADTARVRSLLADMANKLWPGSLDNGTVTMQTPADGLPVEDVDAPPATLPEV